MNIKNDMPAFLSIADSVELNKDRKIPIYFRSAEFDNYPAFIDYMIDNQYVYSPIRFQGYKKINNQQYGYRNNDNFMNALSIALDVDSPDLTMKEAQIKLEELDLFAILMPTKNYMKKKNDEEACERYRIILPLKSPTTSSDIYKLLCKKYSKLICDSKDDHKCHDSARYFDPTPKNHRSRVNYVEGNNLIDPDELSDDEKISLEYSELKKRRKIVKTETLDSTLLGTYQKYIAKKVGLNDIISHINDSNNTINFFRNKKDTNPGCYMFTDDIKIHDNKPDSKGNKVFRHANHSYKQIVNAIENSKKDLEVVRKETHTKLINDIDIKKEFNIIITSEGLGKSSLLPEYINKYQAERIVVVCKSYDQLYGKKELYNKIFPHLDSEIILGGERLLDKYNVHPDEWQYGRDEETGEKYIMLKTTIIDSNIRSQDKGIAIQEIEKYEKIMAKSIDVDIVLMVEDKLRMEVLMKKNFKDDLILWDEFHPGHWFQDRLANEYERLCGKFDKDIYKQETWQGFYSDMIAERNNYFKLLIGKKIILSTENKAIHFFQEYHNENSNIVDMRSIFNASSVNIYSVAPKLVQKDHKENLANAFRVNDFLLWGNGIKSKINHVSMLGQNYHDVIKVDEKIMLIINQPSPGELAPIMKNLHIDDKEATILLLVDVINQYLGRVSGYRGNIPFESFDIIIPNNLINEILPQLRYVCNVHRSLTQRNETEKRSTKTDKILYTLSKKLGVLKFEDKNLYMKSLQKKINTFASSLEEIGTKIVDKFNNMKFYKFTKEMIDKGITNSDLNIMYYRYVKSYGEERTLSLLYSTFSNLLNFKYRDSISVKYGMKIQFLN